jgi:glycosyltransferase involved in cell wall biosynthesis
MEAMAIGIPVIATPVGGTPDIVEDGVTGYLIPTRNPDALADAIVKMLSDRKSAKAMGARGRQKVTQEFSPERYIDKLSAIYEDLLERKRIN